MSRIDQRDRSVSALSPGSPILESNKYARMIEETLNEETQSVEKVCRSFSLQYDEMF